MIHIIERFKRLVAEQRRETAQRVAAALLSEQRVEGAGIDEPHQDAWPATLRGLGTDVEGDEYRAFVGECLAGEPVGTPERCLVGRVGLTEPTLWPMFGELVVRGRQRGSNSMEVRCAAVSRR